jgi:hypothetical protein
MIATAGTVTVTLAACALMTLRQIAQSEQRLLRSMDFIGEKRKNKSLESIEFGKKKANFFVEMRREFS